MPPLAGPAERETQQDSHRGFRSIAVCLYPGQTLAAAAVVVVAVVVVVAAAVVVAAVQTCLGDCDGSVDLPRCVEDLQKRFQDHLEHLGDQKVEVEGHRRGLPEDHLGCESRSGDEMLQADEWGCCLYYSGVEVQAGIVRDVVALFPASHCVLARDAQGLLAVVMRAAYAVVLRAHVPAPGRSPAGRAIDCSS
jgi:hypothetical protein